jgi:hypothetical protein
MRNAILSGITVALLLALGPAQAQKLYKWVDDKGVVHYSERLPAETAGKAAAQLNGQGTVVKRQAAAPTAAEVAAHDAELVREREAAQLQKEKMRRNQALLDTYAGEQDIDSARERALAQTRDALANAEHNVKQLEARRQSLERDAAKSGKAPSARQQRDLDANAIDLRNARAVRDAKQHDIDAINQRYDEDKRRYIELTRGAPVPRTNATLSSAGK